MKLSSVPISEPVVQGFKAALCLMSLFILWFFFSWSSLIKHQTGRGHTNSASSIIRRMPLTQRYSRMTVLISGNMPAPRRYFPSRLSSLLAIIISLLFFLFCLSFFFSPFSFIRQVGGSRGLQRGVAGETNAPLRRAPRRAPVLTCSRLLRE